MKRRPIALASLLCLAGSAQPADEPAAVPVDGAAIELTSTSPDFSYHIAIGADGRLVMDYHYGRQCCVFAGHVHGEGQLTDAARRMMYDEVRAQQFFELPHDINVGKGSRKATDNVLEITQGPRSLRVHLIDRRTADSPAAGPTRVETRFFGVMEAVLAGCPAFPQRPSQ